MKAPKDIFEVPYEWENGLIEVVNANLEILFPKTIYGGHECTILEIRNRKTRARAK